MICEYGCKQEGTHQFKNGKWCCSSNISLCPKIKEKIGEKNKGNIMPNIAKEKLRKINLGKKLSPDTKEKISLAHKKNPNKACFKKGNTPWNKGLTKETDTRLKKQSMNQIGQKATINQRLNQSKVKKELYKNKKKHPSYKGKYYSQNIPRYNTYSKQLTIEETPKRDIIDQNILTVVCTYCKKRFIPKASSVQERVRSLKGTQNGENRLYCSDECKEKCPIYRSHGEVSILKTTNKNYTQSEYQEFRKHVLKRDNYKCQYCNEKAEYVHHERPQKLEPFFALDPDLAWSVCKKCHYEKGHAGECSTGKLANVVCREVI